MITKVTTIICTFYNTKLSGRKSEHYFCTHHPGSVHAISRRKPESLKFTTKLM